MLTIGDKVRLKEDPTRVGIINNYVGFSNGFHLDKYFV